jgi:hypothetical protein
MQDATTIYQDRTLTNADLARRDPQMAEWFQHIGVDPSKHTVDLTSGKLLIIDPMYLADIYNEDGSKEQYLKRMGVLLTDFGGDVSGPVFRTTCGGIKIVLVFDRVDGKGRPVFRPEATEELSESEIASEDLGCDSGSYLLLDYSEELQLLFADKFEALQYFPLFVVDLPPGRYNAGYEQWETDANNPYESWRRNLVIWPV